jgi:hypothetical protein
VGSDGDADSVAGGVVTGNSSINRIVLWVVALRGRVAGVLSGTIGGLADTSGMSWNYRIVRVHHPAGPTYPATIEYGVYEVYYDTEGHPTSRTSQPVGFIGETPEGLMGSLERARRDAMNRPILDDTEIGSSRLPLPVDPAGDEGDSSVSDSVV